MAMLFRCVGLANEFDEFDLKQIFSVSFLITFILKQII